MNSHHYFNMNGTSLALALFIPCLLTSRIVCAEIKGDRDPDRMHKEDIMVVNAALQSLQAPGVSIITKEDIDKKLPSRDINELIRTMPGVNLTGNSTSGQRGNSRQIDIRGMGPENTLILIDGKPVTSRNSVRQGWRGERDTRGDTAWFPPELIERIDVLRGPSAARYGNGAAGGVVNIITKTPDYDQLHGSLNSYLNIPQHKQEGNTKRINFSLSGPLSESLGFRLSGGYSKTQADAWDINESHKSERSGWDANSMPAGREGVKEQNINALLHWKLSPLQALIFEYQYGRQGNLYAGDTQNTNTNFLVKNKYGEETNRIYREAFGINYRRAWDTGASTSNYIQLERTRNSRMNEGLDGANEGIFDTKNTGFSTARLDNIIAHSEVSIPFNVGTTQTMTLGAEWNQQRMKDAMSVRQQLTGGTITGFSTETRSPYTSANIFSLFIEDNIELADTTMITPVLRYDYHSSSGNNLSPSLSLSQELGDSFTLKMGIARAYKAPNLFQTNKNYLLYSKGMGCAAIDTRNGCYLLGNEDLEAETSINKEIGLEYHNPAGWLAGITYFRNDIHNKIEAGTRKVGVSNKQTTIYQWENIPKAVVQGIEGTINIPIGKDTYWSNNITYMFENNNKTTGDYLSVIPEFTINSGLRWQATDSLSMQSTLTWYGRQKPKKINYKGNPATGTETNEISPYSILGISAKYAITKNLSVTAGVDNIFDKRLFRAGNSLHAFNPITGEITMYGAGAETYNEPGRTYYFSVNTHF